MLVVGTYGLLTFSLGVFLTLISEPIKPTVVEVRLVEVTDCTPTWSHPTADSTGIIRIYVCEE